ncbi:hypothetical protein DFH11DRAFT_1557654 [Phellopilus nigrolimitatus]|nr:hypothetical protein DFH11DRAFT_1557654 [Phellopilus nigrolimitatus]
MFDMERYISSDLDTDEFDSLSSTPSSPLDADADAAPPNPVKNTFCVRRNAFNYNSPQPRSISSPRMAKLQHHGAAPHQIPVDAATPARPEPDAADYEADAAAFSIGSSVFDSDTESEGPITPETRAADADADGANVVRLDDMAELNIGEADPGLAEAAASVVAILVQNMGKGKAPAHVPGMGPVPDEPSASNIVWNVTDGAVA